MKYPRNSPCPCGSGKKYKHCHYGKPFDPARDASVKLRNRALIAAAGEIFGFSRGRTWADFKQNISGQQIREFYEYRAAIWPPYTDWEATFPLPDGKLRALYLGDINPPLILKNLVRFSLYSDELLVIDPFHNPWILRPEYNPIENPDQFKADTLKSVYFLAQVAPWILAGIVQLIPDPTDFDLKLKHETWRLAQARRGDLKPDERDIESGRAEGREELRRIVNALPEDRLFQVIEKSGTNLSESQKAEFLRYARQQLKNDPIALEQPLADTFREGQLMVMRSGVNMETALLIESVTGAFPYTNLFTRWQEIVSAREAMGETARVWSPLTKAFQSLEFRFLENVDPRFAQRVRADGRLETFRALLRKIGRSANDLSDISKLETYVRDCKDELIAEYKRADAEWGKIEHDFIKWAGRGIAAGLIGGQLVPDISTLSVATLVTLGQLANRFLKQRQFRKINPMSVLIDLSRREPPGGTTLF